MRTYGWSNFRSALCTRKRIVRVFCCTLGRVNCSYTCTYASARTVRAAYVDGVAVWLRWLLDSPPLLSVTRVAAVPEQTRPKTFVSCATSTSASFSFPWGLSSPPGDPGTEDDSSLSRNGISYIIVPSDHPSAAAFYRLHSIIIHFIPPYIV